MPRFVANLTSFGPSCRGSIASRRRRAGFSHMEILFVHDLDREEVKRILDANGLTLHLFDQRAGDWAACERGLLCLPGREAECLGAIRDAIVQAQFLGRSGSTRWRRRRRSLPGSGTGAQPIHAFLRTLDERGYEGRVGLEYKPLGSTEDSLAFCR